jgi:hypothetical protein
MNTAKNPQLIELARVAANEIISLKGATHEQIWGIYQDFRKQYAQIKAEDSADELKAPNAASASPKDKD